MDHQNEGRGQEQPPQLPMLEEIDFDTFFDFGDDDNDIQPHVPPSGDQTQNEDDERRQEQPSQPPIIGDSDLDTFFDFSDDDNNIQPHIPPSGDQVVNGEDGTRQEQPNQCRRHQREEESGGNSSTSSKESPRMETSQYASTQRHAEQTSIPYSNDTQPLINDLMDSNGHAVPPFSITIGNRTTTLIPNEYTPGWETITTVNSDDESAAQNHDQSAARNPIESMDEEQAPPPTRQPVPSQARSVEPLNREEQMQDMQNRLRNYEGMNTLPNDPSGFVEEPRQPFQQAHAQLNMSNMRGRGRDTKSSFPISSGEQSMGLVRQDGHGGQPAHHGMVSGIGRQEPHDAILPRIPTLRATMPRPSNDRVYETGSQHTIDDRVSGIRGQFSSTMSHPMDDRANQTGHDRADNLASIDPGITRTLNQNADQGERSGIGSHPMAFGPLPEDRAILALESLRAIADMRSRDGATQPGNIEPLGNPFEGLPSLFGDDSSPSWPPTTQAVGEVPTFILPSMYNTPRRESNTTSSLVPSSAWNASYASTYPSERLSPSPGRDSRGSPVPVADNTRKIVPSGGDSAGANEVVRTNDLDGPGLGLDGLGLDQDIPPLPSEPEERNSDGNISQDSLWDVLGDPFPPMFMDSIIGDNLEGGDGNNADDVPNETSGMERGPHVGNTTTYVPKTKGSRVYLLTNCTECRRRKLGCNKKKPCAHCIEKSRECVYLVTSLDSKAITRRDSGNENDGNDAGMAGPTNGSASGETEYPIALAQIPSDIGELILSGCLVTFSAKIHTDIWSSQQVANR